MSTQITFQRINARGRKEGRKEEKVLFSFFLLVLNEEKH